jgi:hypothetical protein
MVTMVYTNSFFAEEKPLNVFLDYKICMRRMNRQKPVNSQGLPYFQNQIRITESKSKQRNLNANRNQFRIRKRQESAKGSMKNRVRKGKNSVK